MGSDNQAERVILRLEWREQLARRYLEAHQRELDETVPWRTAEQKAHAAVLAGVQAILDEINRRTQEQFDKLGTPEYKEGKEDTPPT